MKPPASLSPHLAFCLRWLKYAAAPLLLAVYPAVFHYSNNAANLLPVNLGAQLLLYLGIGLLVFAICSAVFRQSLLSAANAAAVFLLFFHLYGLLYDGLIRLDWFRVEHFNLLPVFLLTGLLTTWLAARLPLRPAGLAWKGILLVFAALCLYNLVRILPVEVAKTRLTADLAVPQVSQQSPADPSRPDIYYIIMDEFSGIPPMREYWHNPQVEPFLDFLAEKGFQVAEDSRGSTTNTLHQMAIRFNYQDYSLDDPDYLNTWFNAIADNLAMRYLKSLGYTTVVFDEKFMGYPSEPPILADVSYNYGQIPETGPQGIFDDYGMLIANNTLLRLFAGKIQSSRYAPHINMIRFTTEKIGSLGEVPSPKFVHVHLMLPHAPFMFDENGRQVTSQNYHDWGNYLENYNYAMKVAETLVSNILAAYDPANPPVIILQSDHGCRNKADGSYTGVLENFPPEYKTSILYAVLLPGLQPSQFPPDIDPINTFPLVFNQLFKADLPIK